MALLNVKSKVFYVRNNVPKEQVATIPILENTLNDWLNETRFERTDLVSIDIKTYFTSGKPGDTPVEMMHIIQILYI